MHPSKNPGINVYRRLEMALVMPDYNEQDCTTAVARSWRDVISSMGIEFRITVLNDGSCDSTGERLGALSATTALKSSLSRTVALAGHPTGVSLGDRDVVLGLSVRPQKRDECSVYSLFLANYLIRLADLSNFMGSINP